MIMLVFIYILTDPISGDTRYVGLTRDVKKRWGRYCRPHTKHLANWFNYLKGMGTCPVMLVIDECLESECDERERMWIAYYRASGCKLMNYTDGGEKGYRPTEKKVGANRGRKFGPMPEETRRKISEANKGRKAGAHSSELAKRNAAAMRGTTLSAEHRRKVSEGVRRAQSDPEVRKRMSEGTKRGAAKRHAPTDETKRKLSAIVKQWHAENREKFLATMRKRVYKRDPVTGRVLGAFNPETLCRAMES